MHSMSMLASVTIALGLFGAYLSGVKRFGVGIFVGALCVTSSAAFADDCNAIVLEQISKMPRGGRYSTSHVAKIRLQSSAHFESGKFFFLPAKGPSFCSGATYQVF